MQSEKHKRLVRLFFNTYYEDAANNIIKELERLAASVKVTRSRIVPELYYVELRPRELDDEGLERLVKAVEGLLRSDDRVFGVKVYAVKT